MNTLHNANTQILLQDFIKQHPLQPSVIARCESCYNTMVFVPMGFYCKDCIKNELIKRGVNKNRLDDLEQRLVRAQTLQQEIRDLCRGLGVV